MIQTKNIGSLTQLTASEGVLHKIGTDTYCTSAVMLPGETVDMYEEVAEEPPYTKEQYDAKVAELVRERYSASEEFAIQRKRINAMLAPMPLSGDVDGPSPAIVEYDQYNAYVEECKARAKEQLSISNL